TFNAAQVRYEATINTTALVDGSHVVKVRATDNAQQTTLKQISVTVTNIDILGPAITLVSPSQAAPQVLSGALTIIRVSASDPGGVTSVQWQVMDPPLSPPNEVAWQPMTLNASTSNWEAFWQAPGVAADASKILVVRAMDGQGNVSLSTFAIMVSTVQLGPGFAPGALEIFALPPGGDVVPPTLHPDPQLDTTPLPADLMPAGTIALVVLPGATVTALNPNGEWVLNVGGQTVFVYESAGTLKDVVPVGSVVRVVATRTLVAGPIVAEVIRLRPTARPEVVYAFLYSGTVTRADAAMWTVAGADFLIITDPTIGATAIDPGLGVGSVVQVEFMQLPDTTPPFVSITAPAGGTQISGLVTLSANASDNLAMAQVRFLVDGVLIGTDDTAPYSLAWDSTPVLDGRSHILTAQAVDAAGNIVSALVSVTTPDLTAPAVSITSPVNGTTVAGTVSVSANATDLAGVTQVRFLVDGTLLSTDTAAPYSVDWDTTSLVDGQHTVRVEAVDTPGNVGSASVTVTVDNSVPSISITSPTNGAHVGGSITTSASVTDPAGVTQVRFLVDGALLSADTAAPYSAAWDTTSLADGPAHANGRGR
ncbi:MAG: Ig-like domain-containing protein, partial [Chloroflexi bacterium]|nr:Ig-like domain-containing protein [Chloroflexota bacterium]